MLKILGIAIAGLVLYFFIDYSLEYRYWKKEQSQGISFVRSVIEDARKRSKIELENELNSIQAQFADGKTFVPNHDNV